MVGRIVSGVRDKQTMPRNKDTNKGTTLNFDEATPHLMTHEEVQADLPLTNTHDSMVGIDTDTKNTSMGNLLALQARVVET